MTFHSGQSEPRRVFPRQPIRGAEVTARSRTLFPAARRSVQSVCGLFWRAGGASWAESVNEEQTPFELLADDRSHFLLSQDLDS